jgi:hypothetical protein
MISIPLSRRLRQAHHLQRVEHGGMDARDFGLGQGLVLPALRPGRTGRWSSASGAERRATRAARPPPRRLFLRLDFGSHIRTLSDFGS